MVTYASEALSSLLVEWQNYVEQKNPEGRGILEQVKDSLFMPKKLDDELSNSVSRIISELYEDWKFISYYKYKLKVHTGELDPVIQKLCNLSEKIVKDCVYGNKYFKRRPHKLLSLLLEYRTKTDEVLNPETGEALGRFITGFIPHLYDLGRNEYLEEAIKFCHVKVDVLIHNLARMQYIKFPLYWDHYYERALHPHIASAVGKIAKHSFDVWINRRDMEVANVKAAQLVDLGDLIDPYTNPEFMRLLLSFGKKVMGYYFCDYLLTDSLKCRVKGYEVFRSLLEFMVNAYCNLVPPPRNASNQITLFAESVLREISILHLTVAQENKNDDHLFTCAPSDHLLRQVRNLYIELYIMVQIMNIMNYGGWSDHSNPWMVVDDLRTFVQSLGMFVQAGGDDGKFLMLTEEINGLAQPLLQPRAPTKTMVRNTLLLLLYSMRSDSTNGSLLVADLGKFVSDLELFVRANDDDNKYFTLREENIGLVERLLQSTAPMEFMGGTALLHMLYSIRHFKAEDSLLEILNKIKNRDPAVESVEEDQITSLVEQLADYKPLFYTNLIWKLPRAYGTMTGLIEKIALLLEDSEEISVSLANLSDRVKCIKLMLQQISAPSALSNVPKTCSPEFIKFLGRNIKELLKYDPPSIAPMKRQLRKVEQQLETLGSLLMKVSDLEAENGELSDHIRQAAHKLEHILESVDSGGDSKCLFWLHNLIHDISAINRQMAEISNAPSQVPPERSISSKNTRSAINEVMVDLIDEEKAVIDQLMRGSLQRVVVSIAGMAGIGKTTLARKVYDDKNVMHHFPNRAWCPVTQLYSNRELLVAILSGIRGISEEIRLMTDDDLLSKVRRCLLGKRYLIVLDDVWDVGVWDYLQISFPNDSNGSRILTTSRLHDLQSTIKPGSDSHHMRFLLEEESWMLLQKMIFGEGVCCPEELLHPGKKIAQHCQGLPLAVVAIAGLLRKTEQTKDWWEKISESLSTQVISDTENRCKEILELSYKHLPDEMKTCFLYLGVFLGDKDIPLGKLTQLWMAEGFIQESGSKSLKQVAHDCLMELIKRSLVIISGKGSDGKVKSCRLHDLWRDLCLSKAKADNFLNLVTKYDEPYASFPSSHYGMELYDRDKVEPVIFESYRLSINLKRNHFFDSRPSGPGTRSLILSASADKEPRRPYDMSVICKNFRLLRILDLECINIGVSFPDEIGLMVQLRYLAVSGYLGSMPPSIANLWKLQFLVVRAFESGIILPGTIWSMVNLRHLHVNEHVSFDLNEVGSLDNLVSFCTPSFSFGDDTINLLRRLPNLLKMKCIFLESWDSSKNCNRFPVLDILTRLESLKIIYSGRAFASSEFILPFSLRKLTLSGFRLPWNHVSRVGLLPNLRVLKLVSGAFEGPRWEMNEDEFKELEFLKLEDLNIAEWDAYSDHLPNLIQLVVRNCKNLEEIPQDFASIDTLERIQVQWCKASLEESAKSRGDVAEAIKVEISYT